MSTIDRPVEPVLRCEVRPHREAAILALSGELDLATVPLVETELAELRDRGFTSLALDLDELTFIDSTGLRLLVAWTRAAEDGGPSFGLVARPSAAVARALELSGLTDRIPTVRP